MIVLEDIECPVSRLEAVTAVTRNQAIIITGSLGILALIAGLFIKPGKDMRLLLLGSGGGLLSTTLARILFETEEK